MSEIIKFVYVVTIFIFLFPFSMSYYIWRKPFCFLFKFPLLLPT